MIILLLLLLFNTVAAQYDTSGPNINYCSRYIECVAVSHLEERLCLGNSIWRPYWLPERGDKNNCHDLLKNDYTTIERLEEELDDQMNACLSENSQPLDANTLTKCQLLPPIPKFAFSRTITHVPTHCFTGIQRRIERQCAGVRQCCPSIDKCKLLNSGSSIQKLINTTRENLRKRADDCKNGQQLDELKMDGLQISLSTDEQTWAPNGHVNVNIKDEATIRREEKEKLQREGSSNKPGFVNVHFTTAAENEERARKLIIRYGDKEGDGLTLPKLNYPPGYRTPQTTVTPDFDSKFASAMKNTVSYKKGIEKLANDGFESLLDAATVSVLAPPMGTVTLMSTDAVGDTVVEDMGRVTEEVVTTSPIIFVEKEAKEGGTVGVERCTVSKGLRFGRILKLLGERKESKDTKEIRQLIDKFESSLRGKNLSSEAENKAKLIEKSLEMLLDKFDENRFEKVEKDAENVILDSKDVPMCEEDTVDDDDVQVLESIDETNTTMLVDDNGDKLIIQKGTPTLHVGSGTEKVEKSDTTEGIQTFISKEYKAEIEQFRKEHNLWTRMNKNATVIKRNETTCDMYMRCRSQMHMAVDSCAWRFASDQLLATMAESAESLLFKDDGICSQADGEKFVSLYENMIKRNDKLRKCLDEKNQKFFDDSICLAYPEEKRKVYDKALGRLLDSAFEYQKSRECFKDANLIQEKCTLLRDCCPNFDVCREKTFDVEMERMIINLTAKINDIKQECVKKTAKDAVKNAIRQLLLSTKAGEKLQTIAQFGLDISRGARVVRMAKYRT